ncbi:hypothetical protein J2N86_13305 [Legionella lytica]|uniref:Peptidase C80 domain-containing protein n=1 Tax=Legionella lytica TaxID=96232 RepID=A0ABY4Y7N5_9GAMM|nr:hypothetical protein [Legionella lytica]USQ13638.1 hypothetical protein J2N86_13305 [Legionella lytica]
MKRRVWVIRVGDHWFLRHVRDLYETLTSTYSSSDQPRGILSVFPKEMPSPFWFRKQQKGVDNLACYLKDRESERSFSEILNEDTDLKIYIAGHCSKGSSTLQSLETDIKLIFDVQVQTIARQLHELFLKTQVNPTVAKPIKISLISCYAATPGDGKDSFAVQLLEQLHRLGHEHILVKAREEAVSAPIFGKKYTSGKKEHFYLDTATIYQVEKKNDLHNLVLKTLKSCHSKTKVSSKRAYLESCLEEIEKIGYPSKEEQITALKTIIAKASSNAEVQQYQYGTGWFMRLFNLQSNTAKTLKHLENELNDRADLYSEIKKL